MQVPIIQQQNIIGQASNSRQQVNANPESFGANLNPTAGIVGQAKEMAVRQDTAAKMMALTAEATGNNMVHQSEVQLAQANMGVASAGMKLGDVVADFGAKIQEKRNIIAVMNASNAWDKAVSDGLFGSSGLYKLKGENADGVVGKGETMFSELRKQFVESISSPAARLAFTQHIYTRENAYRTSLMTHQEREMEFAADSGFKGSIAVAANSAGKDPLLLPAQVESVSAAATLYAKRKGLTPESTSDLIANSIGTVVSAAVQPLVDNNRVNEARAIYEAYKKLLPAETDRQLNKLITTGQREFAIDSLISEMKKTHVKADGRLDFAGGLAAIDARFKNTAATAPAFDSIMSAAKPFIGMEYGYGANGKNGAIDCSSFVQQVASKVGVELPRTADYQWKTYKDKGQTFTDASQLKPGDLVFMKNTYDPVAKGEDPAYDGVTHVGIYAGNGKVLQAGSAGVGYQDISVWKEIAGYARMTGSGSGGFDIKARDAAVAAWKTAAAETDHSITQFRSGITDTVFNMAANKSMADITKYLNDNNITGEFRTRVENAVRSEINRDTVSTPIAVWNEVHDRLTGPANGKSQLTSVNQLREEYTGVMGNSDLKAFTHVLDTLGNKKAAGDTLLDSDGIKTMIQERAKVAGLRGDKFKEVEVLIYARIAEQFTSLAEKYGGANKVPKDELHKVVLEQTAKVVIEKGVIWDTQAIRYQIPAGYVQDPVTGKWRDPKKNADGTWNVWSPTVK